MSKLQAIKAKLAAMLEENIIETPVEVKMGVVKTDKAVLEFDGDEDLVAGMPVYVTNEETGERTPATDGEYITEDNKTISVVDGKVESIVDPVAEVDGADEEKPIEEPTEETPVEENPTEVEKAEEVENPDGSEEPTPDAVEELRKEVDELYKIVDSILEKIGESRREADERFAKIEKMSAAASAEQKLEEMTNPTTTKIGDAKLDAKLDRVRQMNKDWKA